MSPFWLLGLAAAGAGVYYLTQQKSAPTQPSPAANAANFMSQAASYNMSAQQAQDAASMGLSPYEYMSTLASLGRPPTDILSQPATTTSLSTSGTFYDPLSKQAYGF